MIAQVEVYLTVLWDVKPYDMFILGGEIYFVLNKFEQEGTNFFTVVDRLNMIDTLSLRGCKVYKMTNIGHIAMIPNQDLEDE